MPKCDALTTLPPHASLNSRLGAYPSVTDFSALAKKRVHGKTVAVTDGDVAQW